MGLNTGNRYCACDQKDSILNFGKRWLPEKTIDEPIKADKSIPTEWTDRQTTKHPGIQDRQRKNKTHKNDKTY